MKTCLMNAGARRIGMLPATALTGAYGSTQNAFVLSLPDLRNDAEIATVTADGKPLSIGIAAADYGDNSVCLLLSHCHRLVMVFGRCDISIPSDGFQNHSHKSRVVASSSCLDPLTGNPLVKVKLQEPHPGSREFYEGDASFLDEASNKPFGTSEMTGGCSDVQEWSIDVFATGSLANDRNFLGGWCSIHETPPWARQTHGSSENHPSCCCPSNASVIGVYRNGRANRKFSPASSNNRRRFLRTQVLTRAPTRVPSWFEIHR
jgi:hypothetical protein